MTLRLLTVANIAISLVVWLPAWRKMLRTRSAGDYHMGTMLMILYLQFGSLAMAVIEHAGALALYTGVNALIVLATCLMVRRFQ